uniref:MucR family transcriptional regulator n=1 Tax=uncultured Bilophila sp. TaxID=529385 RepID=UPI0025E96EEE|nr:MucR family transcriptional regulator [uncultured Bilophila sp.]
MGKQVPLESSVVATIIKKLNAVPGCRVKKFHGSAFGMMELDIYGCFNGRAVFIEVKRPGGKPEEAIGDNTVQCCICGKAFQNLSAKHIQDHELTVEEYKKLCGYGREQKLISRNLLAKLQENVQKAQEARCRRPQATAEISL